jgi:hypothetical protein
MDKDLAVVTSYIMYNDLLDEYNGYFNSSFFSKIDKAIQIAELFCSFYSADFNWEESELDFEETLEEFVKKNK